MTTAMKTMSPYDAIHKVTFAPDAKSARANRFGIGYGQRGYAGNKHFPTRTEAESAFEEMLAELRGIYGTPARNWTGKYLEEDAPFSEQSAVFRRVRFVPIRKDGKHGKAIHSLYLYTIKVTQDEIDAIQAALKIPVS